MGTDSEAASPRADAAGIPGPTGQPLLPELPAAALKAQRVRTLTWCGGALAVCAVACVVATAAGPAASGAVVFLIAPVLVAAAGPVIRRWRLGQLLADGRFREQPDQAISTALTAALGPAGVTQVAVRLGKVAGLARAFRAGPQAIVLVHEAVLGRPDLSGFFIAHEVGHIIRSDFTRRPVVVVSAVAAWAGLVLAWPPVVAALPVLLILAALLNRSTEYACDRFAAQWAGPASAQAALSVLAVAWARDHRSPVIRLRSLMTYPSPQRRLAAIEPPLPDRAAVQR